MHGAAPSKDGQSRLGQALVTLSKGPYCKTTCIVSHTPNTVLRTKVQVALQ